MGRRGDSLASPSPNPAPPLAQLLLPSVGMAIEFRFPRHSQRSAGKDVKGLFQLAILFLTPVTQVCPCPVASVPAFFEG